jgi:hypothetical protein
MKFEIFYVLIFLINFLHAQSEEENMIKKSKVLACIALTKARMAKDSVN